MLTLDDAVTVALQYMYDHLDCDIDQEDEELLVQNMEQKCWLHQNSDEPRKQMVGLIMDVNPAEIASQIESDSLRRWCSNWQVEAQLTLMQTGESKCEEQQWEF